MFVRGYILGFAFNCSGDTQDDECYEANAEGNAGFTAFASGRGVAEAYSYHWYTQDGVRTDLPNQTRNIVSKTEEEECEEAGHIWDGLNCEINPDAPGSPIVIATGKDNKYKFTSVALGVAFDLNGDGRIERVAWTEPGSGVAFLAFDRNGDGVINNGKELFGNFTLPGSPNGFDALQRTALESNGGVIRASVSTEDPVFSKLVLWTDSNHNGVSESVELRPAHEVLSDIGLGYQLHDRKDSHGNRFLYRGWAHVRTKPGRNKASGLKEDKERRRAIYDVFLVTQR